MGNECYSYSSDCWVSISGSGSRSSFADRNAGTLVPYIDLLLGCKAGTMMTPLQNDLRLERKNLFQKYVCERRKWRLGMLQGSSSCCVMYSSTKHWLQDVASVNIHTTSYYQVVLGTCRDGSFDKETWLIGIHGELNRIELKWNEMNEMNALTWINWHERIERNELHWMNETNELKWQNLNQQLDMNDLKRMNWHEWLEANELIEMNELKRMPWTEWMTWMNWNEQIETNEVK